MSSTTPETKYRFSKTFPMPTIDRSSGQLIIKERRVLKDPYDIRIENRVRAGELPPEEPPVELAQNE